MDRFDFKTFWFKYRNLILGALFFMMLINFCGRRPAPNQPVVSPRDQEQPAEVQSEKDGPALKSYEEILRDRQLPQQDRPNTLLILLFLIGVAAFLVWQYQTRWKARWFPGKVLFKTIRFRDKATGRRLLQLSIVNRSPESLTFMPPMVVFKKWGTIRQFKLKGSNNKEMFPLTLTPGTSHRVVIDLDQFFEKMPELKTFNRVGGIVGTSSGQKYQSFTSPLWMGF